MDTFKLYVFALTCITLIIVQTNVDAAPGDDCSADSTVCDTSNNEICTETTCVCDDGYYESEGSCASNNALKPTSLQSYEKTHNSVTLTWSSPDAPGYTNSHVINYSEQGGSVEIHNVNGNDTFTLIPNLKAGTTYTFTVVRSIIREGRTQEVPASDPYSVTTNGVYLDSCTAVDSPAECGPDLVCVSGTERRCLCMSGTYYTGSSCAAKKGYGDMCTNTSECLTGLACDSNVNKCLCPVGSYYTTTCTSNDALKPVNLQSNLKTSNSATLSWTSPDASDYTNSYVINYNELGGTVKTHNVNGQDTVTVIPNLKAGTTYNFNVVRSITRQGRTQAVPGSDSYPVTTYLNYLDICTTVGTSAECRPGLVCVVSGTENKCLCTAGNYYTGSNCISITNLRPSITSTQPTSTTSVTIKWTSPAATEYTNSYVIKYTEVGTTNETTSPVSGDVSTHPVTGLKAGTSYNFTVVRSITREGRIQTGIDSPGVVGTSEKIDYGDPCESSGTCKNKNTDCYSSTCRCNPGYFWDNTLCSTNANLSPIDPVTERLSTTQLRVTWTAPAYPNIVTGYLVDLSPSVSSENIVITGTSAIISSLTPGELYSITISSSSNYLNRGETAAAGAVSGITKPAATAGRAPATSLMAPTAQIYFYKAVGRADSYTVTLTGDDYSMVRTPSGPEDELSASFPDVSAGLYYNLTIITVSHGVLSDPFSERIRVSAEAPEAVVDLQFFEQTSRAASVSWKRPGKTKGALYKYTIEVFNSTTCVQRINIQCTECLQALNVSESTENSCERETNTTINKSNLNDENFLVRYDLSLLPDTIYTVVVAVYNEEGKGKTDQVTVYTEKEAPGDPTGFTYVNKTSESVELTWTPPEPRPGVTTYIISVYELDEDSNQYRTFKDVSTLGFYNVSINVTGLSSYWKYSFEMFARTIKGDSNATNVDEVTTDESAPTAVENFEDQPVDGVYNQYQLSWRCPPQKDGRNGVIRSATVITSSLTESVHSPKIGTQNFNSPNCTWKELISVTPEFNYTFEVYISNSIKGESTTIQRYVPAGPASLSRESVPAGQTTSSTELTTISILICPSCILDPKNGIVILSGIIVCKGSCNTNRRKRQAKSQADYEQYKTWAQSKKNSFNDPYIASHAGWLASNKDSYRMKYIIGNDTKCPDKSETVSCNGPLEEGTTYKCIVFACTSEGCDETEEVSISTAETPSNIGGIIGGVVGVLAGVFVVIIVVIVVRRRRARPTTKSKLHEHSDEEELILKKRPIQIKNFEKRTEEMHRDSNLLFSEEFEDINALSPKETCIASETNGNKLKNRYVNILPFDATRIKLRQTEDDEEGSDYINANYIPGYSSPREYIATQGPMTGTITDFWRMIWEQNVPIIIMLSDLQEKGKPKVDRYYPENMEPVQYGDIVLEMTNFSPLNKYVIRIFKLQVGEEVRMVRHYFLPGWQDFGANLNSDDVIDFVKNVRREIKPNNTGPMCVHCSAGVGRTGTYIALDVFQQHIDEEKLDKEIDIFDFVLKMRHNRSYMVQTEKQYIFIHDTIKEMVIKKKKEIAERDNIYMNNENTGGEDIYVNQAFETDAQDIYMNVDDSSGKPTTVL